MNMSQMLVFGGSNSKKLASIICERLGVPLAESDTLKFPDGEILVKVDEDVRGRDCFVVLSTSDPVNDNLMEMLIFIDCLRRASAGQIVVVIPYFGYARQDRKDKGRVPITAKLVANLITEAGADRIIALDLHTAQMQGFFDIPVDHLSGTPVFLEYFRERRSELGDLCVLSPDVGNAKVAENIANLLNGDMAIINKKRLTGTRIVSDHRMIGEVKGKTVLMFDDMISTGSTMIEAAKIAQECGAKKILAAATHGIFSGEALRNLAQSPIDQIVTTNSVPRAETGRMFGYEKFINLCVGGLLAEGIHRVHNNLSVSDMFDNGAGVKR